MSRALFERGWSSGWGAVIGRDGDSTDRNETRDGYDLLLECTGSDAVLLQAAAVVRSVA